VPVQCVLTPEMTEGPYYLTGEPERRDVTEGKAGTPLRLQLTVADASKCLPIPGAVVEIWHADAQGAYSGFGAGASNHTFLRGSQVTDANGVATFDTIYPGWYQGRATHIHVEVTINGVSRKVTQMAFPETVNNTVHTSGVYSSRGNNPMSNSSDGIFSDSLSSEIVTPTGDPNSGYAATFQVGI